VLLFVGDGAEHDCGGVERAALGSLIRVSVRALATGQPSGAA
jgi:hypothetical protein